MIRYQVAGEDLGALHANPAIHDDAGDWWAGAAKCLATVAIATTLATNALTAQLALTYQELDDGNAIGALHAKPVLSDEVWVNPEPPALWPLPPVSAFTTDGDWVPAPVASVVDDDSPPVELLVAAWGTSARAFLDDGNDLGNLHASPAIDEDYWQSPIPAPLLWPITVHPFTADDEPVPTLAVEDGWIPPAPWLTPKAAAFTDTDDWPTGLVAGVASGSFTISGSGTATVAVAATGTGAFTVAGSGVAVVDITSTATGSFGFAGSGTATVGVTASASGAVTIAGSGSAVVAVSGAASGTVVITGAGTGVVAVTAGATGGFVVAGSGTVVVGNPPVGANGTGAFVVTGSATATVAVTGQSTGGFVVLGSATANVGVLGTGSGGFVVTGSGTARAADGLPPEGFVFASLTLVPILGGVIDLSPALTSTLTLRVALTGTVSNDASLGGTVAVSPALGGRVALDPED